MMMMMMMMMVVVVVVVVVVMWLWKVHASKQGKNHKELSLFALSWGCCMHSQSLHYLDCDDKNSETEIETIP